MPVYWSFFLMTIVFAAICQRLKYKKILIEGTEQKRIPIIAALFPLLYICFFVGLRDHVLDTGAYIQSFKNTPTNFNDLNWYIENVVTGKGFVYIQFFFKSFISQNYYVWLTFLALLSCLCLFRVIYKYSINYPLTIYLFVASTNFTWLLNGTRQYLAICILFAFSDWLIQKKYVKYILLILFVSTIHSSAIFMIPICLFVSSDKIFDKKMILFVILTAIGTIFSENVFDYIGDSLDKDYSEALSNGTGSSIINLFIALVPTTIVLLFKPEIENKAAPSIRLAINMSLVASCFMFASSFTNGILIGRMPAYFSIYNLYLLPWLINNCFHNKNRKIVMLIACILYGLLFYYQMMIAWRGLTYVSDILNIYYW